MRSLTVAGLLALSATAAASMATLHDYPSMADPMYANNPPFCEVPWASLDLGRITAWGLIDKSACGTCLHICGGNGCGYFLVADRSTDSAGHVDVSLAAGPAVFGDVTGRWPDAKVAPVDASFCTGIWNGRMFDDATPAYGQLADLKAMQGGGLAQKAVSVPGYGAAGTSVAAAAAASTPLSTRTVTVDADGCSTSAVAASSAAVSPSSAAVSQAASSSSAAASSAALSSASPVVVSSAAPSSVSVAAAVPTTASSSSSSSLAPLTSASSSVKSTSSSLAYAAAASSVSHSHKSYATNTTRTTTTTISSTITVSVTRLSTGATAPSIPTGCLSAGVSAGTASAGLYCGSNSTATTYSLAAQKPTATKATFTGAAVSDRPAVLLVGTLTVLAAVFAQL